MVASLLAATMVIVILRCELCAAAKLLHQAVLKKYKEDGYAFVERIVQDSAELEEISGLKQMKEPCLVLDFEVAPLRRGPHARPRPPILFGVIERGVPHRGAPHKFEMRSCTRNSAFGARTQGLSIFDCRKKRLIRIQTGLDTSRIHVTLNARLHCVWKWFLTGPLLHSTPLTMCMWEGYNHRPLNGPF